MSSNCEVCSKELTSGQERFCSRGCLYRHSEKNNVRICLNCQKEFTAKQWELNRKTRTNSYCSRQCWAASRKGSIRDDLRKRIKKICPVCKNEFETGGRAGKVSKTFCSWECRYQARYRSGKKANQIEIGDAQYLAGLVDGEGSIFLYGRDGVVALRLTISSTNHDVLDWVMKITGIGSIVTTKGRSEKHSTSYFWQVNSEGAESVIEQIRPHLKIKMSQAELALETRLRLRDPALKANRTWQSEYRERMQALNRRGP